MRCYIYIYIYFFFIILLLSFKKVKSQVNQLQNDDLDKIKDNIGLRISNFGLINGWR